MTQPTKNWPLLWKTYDHIVEHPEEWGQDDYGYRTPCGTKYCFAGTAVVIGLPEARFLWSKLDSEGAEFQAGLVEIDNSCRVTIAHAAMDVLGLNHWESDLLFAGTNSIEEITRLLHAWEAADGQ